MRLYSFLNIELNLGILNTTEYAMHTVNGTALRTLKRLNKALFTLLTYQRQLLAHINARRQYQPSWKK